MYLRHHARHATPEEGLPRRRPDGTATAAGSGASHAAGRPRRQLGLSTSLAMTPRSRDALLRRERRPRSR
jgi:hypothetical protein